MYPGIRALDWIPRVTTEQRPAFEAQMRLDGRTRPEITDGEPAKAVQRAAQRPEYYPVQYLYPPTESTRNVLGFDVSLSDLFISTMKCARETGQACAADQMPLLERTSDGFGIPVLLPVFRHETELAGFVLGIFQIEDILERAMKYVGPKGINIQLLDDSASEGRRDLYLYRSRLAGMPQRSGMANSDVFRYSVSVNVAARRWRIVCASSPEFTSSADGWKPRTIAAIGGLLTLLDCVLTALNIRRNERTDRLVEELSRANEEMSREIGQLR